MLAWIVKQFQEAWGADLTLYRDAEREARIRLYAKEADPDAEVSMQSIQCEQRMRTYWKLATAGRLHVVQR